LLFLYSENDSDDDNLVLDLSEQEIFETERRLAIQEHVLFLVTDSLKGLRHPDWMDFHLNLASGKVYVTRVNDFALFRNKIEGGTDTEALKKYFQAKRALTNEDGTIRHCPSSMRSWYAMFKKFWLFTGRGDLKALTPIIGSWIDNWEKTVVSILCYIYSSSVF
jgi:hypothetical protein